MNIREGIQLEVPDVFIPWETSEKELRDLLEPFGLRKVTKGYFTISCQSLSGMEHELGFHFIPRGGDNLQELEFFRRSYDDQQKSYDEFQSHFEQHFGKPTSTRKGTEGFPTQVWNLKGVEISHYVFDRFGAEEHMRIKKTTNPTRKWSLS